MSSTLKSMTKSAEQRLRKKLKPFTVDNKFSLEAVFLHPERFGDVYINMIDATRSFNLKKTRTQIERYFRDYETPNYFLTHPDDRVREAAKAYYEREGLSGCEHTGTN